MSKMLRFTEVVAAPAAPARVVPPAAPPALLTLGFEDRRRSRQ